MSDESTSTRVLRASPAEVELMDPITREPRMVGLVMDTNALADLETHYKPVIGNRYDVHTNDEGEQEEFVAEEDVEMRGLEAWQWALRVTPVSAIRDTLALCIGEDPRTVGAQMIPTKMRDYANAIGVAFAIANGVDPTKAQELVEKASLDGVDAPAAGALAASNRARSNRSSTRGTGGSKGGRTPAARSTSSGT